MEVPIREINRAYDVIVIGGGPAGCAAATASARVGAKTLLIEASGCLGGMGTNGLVPAWCPFSDGQKIIYRGVALEVFEKLKSMMEVVPAEQADWTPISAEKLKRVYDELLTASGADILFYSYLCGTECEEGRIQKILVANKRGITCFEAKIFIDTTGDGDLAAFAGAAFEKGDAEGNVQAATLCFQLANVDMEAYKKVDLAPESYASPIYDILHSGRYPHILDEHLCASVIEEGVLGFNAGHMWNVDSEDVFGMARNMIMGRKIAAEYRDALAEFRPEAFGNSCVVSTAVTMGTRESRRIQGVYTLTVEDYLARRSFTDEIARNCYYIDVHANEQMSAASVEERINNIRHTDPYEKGESHGIPFRCLVPRGFENLLVAGRILSCDRRIFGSLRVMPNCLTTGQAAGTAAAIAIENNCGIPQLNIQKVRAVLRENGAYFV